MRKSRKFVKNARKQRGSALLVTLMVLVGLSLLGLGFVAVSESESAISVNERNHMQVLSMAESGAKAVAQCFNFPAWCQTQGLIPANANSVSWKTTRTLNNPSYNGVYKADTTLNLTDKPWRPDPAVRLLGSENSPDLKLNTTTASTYITNLNSRLFSSTTDATITEVAIYSPPIVGGTLNSSGFWEGGTRYGVATVKVTAEKVRGTDVMARASVKVTVSEFPVPVPGGPYQSSGGMSFSGDQEMHWGKVTAMGDVNSYKVDNWNTSVPWHDAWEHLHFEHGYDSSDPWTASTVVQSGDILRPVNASAAAQGIEYTVKTAGTTGAAEPGCSPCSGTSSSTSWLLAPLQTTVKRTVTNGTAVLEERYPTGYPNTTGYDQYDWLYEVVGKQFGDPWLEVRVRSPNVNLQANGPLPAADSATAPHMYKYDTPNRSETAIGKAGHSNIFRNQIFNNRPDQREVTFPKMDYNFWKQMAQAGSQLGTPGIHYLRKIAGSCAGANQYSDGTTCQNWNVWVNVASGGTALPGFYFFDTTDGAPPSGTTNLATWTSPGGTFLMRGFIYANASFPSTPSGPADYYQEPAEPFRDVGYRKVDTTSVNGDFLLDASGNIVIEGANDGSWSYQDLPNSNGAAAANGRFDVFVAQKTVTKPGTDGGTTVTAWLPVPYYPGCTPGSNGFAGANCSEPHEPYLNMIYPTVPGNWGGYNIATMSPKVAWEAPGSQTRRPRVHGGTINTVVACSGSTTDPSSWTAANQNQCTSNGYDATALLQFASGPPSLDGVLYVQGSYDDPTKKYGAVLINNNAGGGNNQQVWFDQRLANGQWPPAEWNLPRTFVSAIQTEE